MSQIQKTGVVFAALVFLGVLLHELRHFHRYGHLAPLGLHADVRVATSNDVLGVEGTAKIYEARLTNFGLVPATVLVCRERVAGAPTTNVNYIVERWDHQLGDWTAVPEWDFGGYRLFCRPVFEVTEQHVAPLRLWPGQSVRVGEGIPAQLGGFHVGDDGRFTVFVNADGNKNSAISTRPFRVDQGVGNGENRNCGCSERLSESQMSRQVEHIEMGADAMGNYVNVKGIALMEVSVDDDGGVLCVQALSGHPLAITHLIEASRRWRFKPYVRNGSSQRFCGRLRVNFSFVENKPSVEVVAN